MKRLQLVLNDEELITSIRNFWNKWKNGQYGEEPISQYFYNVVKLLYEEIIYKDNKHLEYLKKAELSETKDELYALMPQENNGKRDLSMILFQKLKESGVNDPNVDSFLAVFKNDLELLKSAIENGADTTITDDQVISQYYDYLQQIAPEELSEYNKI